MKGGNVRGHCCKTGKTQLKYDQSINYFVGPHCDRSLTTVNLAEDGARII